MTTQTSSSNISSIISKYDLDISIVEAKDLGLSHRMDPENYRPMYFENEKKIKSHNWGYFSDYIIEITGGATPLGANYLDSGVPFIRVQNVMQNYFDMNDVVYISKEDDQKLKRSRLKKNDVMLTITGVSYGKSATIGNELVGSNMNQHSVRMSFQNIEPYYISTFLNSYFGKFQSDKNIVGLSRPALDYNSIRNFILPIPTTSFQSFIAEIIQSSHNEQEKSKKFYSEAEKILLEELNLLEWKSTENNIDIKTSDEIKLFGRCDAEFFQPKYDEIIGKLKEFPFKTIAELSSVVGHPSNPSYSDDLNIENKTFVLTQKHLGDFFPKDNFWLDNDALYTTEDFLLNNAKYIIQKDDLILYSVGAYIGKTNIYNTNIPAIIGSFLTLIRPRKELINPYYMMLFMNSGIGQLLTRRNQRGMAQQYIYPYDIREQIIPILSPSIQSKISSLIVSSHEALKLSKDLLEQAKRAVEVFVEKNEEEAMKEIQKINNIS